MAWKVMEEINEMLSEQPRKEEISDKLLQKAVQERNIRLILTDRIYSYIRKTNKGIGQIDQSDLSKMGEGLPERYQGMLMEQFMKALRTNRGKPIQWVKAHHKSILLDQLD